MRVQALVGLLAALQGCNAQDITVTITSTTTFIDNFCCTISSSLFLNGGAFNANSTVLPINTRSLTINNDNGNINTNINTYTDNTQSGSPVTTSLLSSLTATDASSSIGSQVYSNTSSFSGLSPTGVSSTGSHAFSNTTSSSSSFSTGVLSTTGTGSQVYSNTTSSFSSSSTTDVSSTGSQVYLNTTSSFSSLSTASISSTGSHAFPNTTSLVFSNTTTISLPTTTTLTSTTGISSQIYSNSTSLVFSNTTTINPSTTTSTLISTPTSETPTTGYIAVQEAPALASGLNRRAPVVQYVGFDNQLAQAFDELSSASLVSFYPNGTIKYNDLLLSELAKGNQSVLGLSSGGAGAADLSTWQRDLAGNIRIVGATSFCVDSGRNIVVRTSDLPSTTCTPVYLVLLPKATTSSSSCSADGPAATLAPLQNGDIDRSSNSVLTPSLDVVLNYGETQGTQVAVMKLSMKSGMPGVLLANSDKILSSVCSSISIVLTLSKDISITDVLALIPETGTILITNSATCNDATSYGFWLLGGRSDSSEVGSQLTFNAVQKKISDVSTQAVIQYGKVQNSQATFTATETGNPTVPTGSAPTCASASGSSSSSSQTISATSTRPAQSTATSLSDLSPGALEIYNWLIKNARYDTDGSLIMTPPKQTGSATSSAYDPNNLGDQEALQQLLTDSGLPSPDDMFKKAAAGVAGTCSNLAKRGLSVAPLAFKERSTPIAYESDMILHHRDIKEILRRDWDEFCDGIATDIIGGISETAEGVKNTICFGHDLYESRDAIKCFFTGCSTGKTIKTTTYTFKGDWTVSVPTISQSLLTQGPGKTFSCVACTFKMDHVVFEGSIVLEMTDNGPNAAKSAVVTHGVTGGTSSNLRLQSDSAWKGSWNHIFSPVTLGTITLDSAFAITPKIYYQIGYNFETDSAVDVTGGAGYAWNDASINMNILNHAADSKKNWTPNVNWMLPQFSTGAKVSLNSFSQWMVDLQVVVQGKKVFNPRMFSSNSVGISSQFNSQAVNGCAANSLSVNTYVSNDNWININDGVSLNVLLSNGENGRRNQCFSVPSAWPSSADIAAVASDAKEFCTSLINYSPPTKYTTVTSVKTVPSTTHVTSSVTNTITTTIVITHSTSTSYYSTAMVAASTTTIRQAGTVTMGGAYAPVQNSKRDVVPEAAPGGALDRRAVAVPTAMAGWANDKRKYACSQIATGTNYISYTNTVTATSGVTTATVTNVFNANGPLTTTTTTYTYFQFEGYTTVTTPGVAVATSCPVAPATAKCFKLAVRDVPWLEGSYLGDNLYYFGTAMGINPVGARSGSEWGVYSDTFYLDADGHLLAPPGGGRAPYIMLFLKSNSAIYYQDTPFMGLPEAYAQDMARGNVEFAKCSIQGADTCDKRLVCTIGDQTGFWVKRPFSQAWETSPYYLSELEMIKMGMGMGDDVPYKPPGISWYDENSLYRPTWGNPTGDSQYVPMNLGVEDAPCPCNFMGVNYASYSGRV